MSDSSKRRGAVMGAPTASEAASPAAAPSQLVAAAPGVLYEPALHAPEFFATDMIGCAFDGDGLVVRMTFVSNRVAHHMGRPNQIHQVDNVRIVMSVPAAARMAEFLGRFVATARLNRATPPPDTPLQ